MAFKERGNTEITFNIEKHIGVLSEGTGGWKKEVNLVAWNNGATKLDIRDWDEEHRHMSRGITLNNGETEALGKLIGKVKF